MTTLILSLFLACATEPAAPAAASAEAAAAPAAPAATDATAAAGAAPAAALDAACLDKADLADGTADKVSHKCAGCTLLMDGSEAHASAHGGVTFHSCSDGCKGRLDADPAGVLALACAKR